MRLTHYCEFMAPNHKLSRFLRNERGAKHAPYFDTCKRTNIFASIFQPNTTICFYIEWLSYGGVYL